MSVISGEDHSIQLFLRQFRNPKSLHSNTFILNTKCTKASKYFYLDTIKHNSVSTFSKTAKASLEKDAEIGDKS